MSEFVIRYRHGNAKVYMVDFRPWPTWGMLSALAKALLHEKGGVAVEFRGPNGLHGMTTREES